MKPVSRRSRLVAVSLLAAGAVSLGGCGTSMGTAMAELTPEMVRALDGEGYPDLRTIPQVPQTLPSAETWASEETRLMTAAARLNSDPRAGLPRDMPDAETWAGPVRARLDADPRTAQPPAWMQDATWAEQARRALEARGRQ